MFYSLDTMQLFPYEGMEPPEIWLIMLGSVVVRTLKRRTSMKRILGAFMFVAAVILGVTAVQLNYSMVSGGVIDLTLFVHILQIFAVAMIILFNKNLWVDYIACATVLLSGVKPANAIIAKYIGTFKGIWGAVIPVILMIAVVVVIVGLFYAAYKTNKLAIGKGLTVIISCLCLLAAILVGFLINALAASNGVRQISLVAESALIGVSTTLLVIAFFITKEQLARVAIVVSGILSWWTIINEQVITRLVEKAVNINSYKIKGVIPILLGLICFELGKLGINKILDSNLHDEEEDSATEDESSPEEDH